MLHAEPVPVEPFSDSEERAQRLLASMNQSRFAPRRTAGDFDAQLESETEMRRIERAFVEAERAAVKSEARAVPIAPRAFVVWFETIADLHSSAAQALSSWLARAATAAQAQWYAAHERNHDAGFEDWLALTRLNMPEHSKVELDRFEFCSSDLTDNFNKFVRKVC